MVDTIEVIRATVDDWAEVRDVRLAALAAAADLGHRRVVLDVGDHNTAAQRLYAAAGFAPTGRVGSLPPPREHVTEHELVRAVEER